MNEQTLQPMRHSAGVARLRLLIVFAVVLVVGGVAVFLWPGISGSMPGRVSNTAHGEQRKIKYWWDPMMSPPYIADGPGKSPMGMDLVPVYEDLASTANEPATPTTYYCPMHPSYTSDRPGDCPICNMRLVPAKAGPPVTDSSVEGRAGITLDRGRRQLIGVRTGTVERKPVEQTLRAVGRVDYDEKLLSSVNLKVGGWVEQLFVKSTGEEVHKGDPLFALYSPELIEAQRNYVLALQSESQHGKPSGDGALGDLVSHAARERLALLDQSDEQIVALEAAREPPHFTTFFAKSDGVVTKRNIVQGTRIEAGTDLYELADLSTVWVHADVYEYELPLVRAGLRTLIELSSQAGEPITGEVVFVYPSLNENTRTARVRVEVKNDEHRLKPGMYATALIKVDLGEQLVIDDEAVLDSGTRQLVFMDLGEGRFEPRQVHLGEYFDGQVVVRDGLVEGERIVTSGTFLVDSESRLKSALSRGARTSGFEHAGHGK